MTDLLVWAGPAVLRLTLHDPGSGAVGDVRESTLERRQPGPGQLELAPETLWRATITSLRGWLESRPGLAQDLRSIVVTGDPGGLVVWDAETLGMPRAAICSDDRRAVEGPPLTWLREHDPNTWALVEEGRHLLGGPVSYLVARMTRGTWHLTDASWAERTGLLDHATNAWSPERAERAGVPLAALPEVVADSGIGTTDLGVRTEPRTFLGLDLPVRLRAGEVPLSP